MREWLAPDLETANRALVAVQESRLALQAETVRREELRQQAAWEAEQRSARLAAVRLQLQPVFGDIPILYDRIDFLLQLAPVWPQAKWVWVETRQLDRRPGPPSVSVRAPGGGEFDISNMLQRRDTRVSRRVDIIELRAPVFPVDSGFVTLSRQFWNGKYHDATHTYVASEDTSDV